MFVGSSTSEYNVVFKSGWSLHSMLTKVKGTTNPMWYIVSPAAVARSTLGGPNSNWR